MLSDQTAPNTQFLKCYKEYNPDYIFITTVKMEENHISDWIIKGAGIADENVHRIFVDQYSINNIKERLSSFDFDKYERLLFNITGGTKIMTLASYDFFKSKGAEIYYLTGFKNGCLKLDDASDECSMSETHSIANLTLEEYLLSYGFIPTKSKRSDVSDDLLETTFKAYCNGYFNDLDALRLLRENRNSKNGIKGDDFEKIRDFLSKAGYTSKVQNKLDKSECRYLTGEWFEEYIGRHIQDELGLSDENIYVGCKISKVVPISSPLNDVKSILGEEPDAHKTDNEIDVMFMYNGKIHLIECKTAIMDVRYENGELVENNILTDTIYKFDSIKSKFGLRAESYIFTMSDFKEIIANSKNRNNEVKKFKQLLDRASLSRIRINSKEQILSAAKIKDLL